MCEASAVIMGLNPVRAGMVPLCGEYPWSSFYFYPLDRVNAQIMSLLQAVRGQERIYSSGE